MNGRISCHNQFKRQPRNRCGLTLIEVLLATAILVMTVSALAQLQDGGVRAALRAEMESEAVVLCQSELDRLLAEPTLLKDSVSKLDTAADWNRRVSLTPSPIDGLTLVTVELYRSASATSIKLQPVATLSRWAAIPAHDSGRMRVGGQR